jgi:subtilisin family serine protease
MTIKSLLTAVLVFAGAALLAQIAPDKYYVQFTDKNNSPYSVEEPEEFLSQRALDRRDKQNIDIDEYDIPVNPQYIAGVKGTGATILWPTKWLNGVTIYTKNSAVLDAIEDLPYVVSVFSVNDGAPVNEKDFFRNESLGEENKPEFLTKKQTATEFSYGWAEFQIDQINGIPLHNQGYQGQGMVIAVLDAGFSGTEEHDVFDSLWANNQILGVRDYVNIGGDVYTESQHGKSVLSLMGANKPGVMVGTAPKATYWLLRSEDVKSENIIEEYNWVSAAEYADSVGADIINSSLSYGDFDDPQWNHSYDDLDGNTAPATIGADIATAKGMLVCNSAGNSGNSGFPWNRAPADADSVFSVGAVDNEGMRASFSSHGPTVDGRIKPAIMAMGQGTTVAEGTSGVTWGSGTSYSSPIIAGMSACLWQANPYMTVMEIQQAIKESGSRSDEPDNYMGWGIADYEKANWILTTIDTPFAGQGQIVRVLPNPFTDYLRFGVIEENTGILDISIMSASGTVIYKRSVKTSGFAGEKFTINLPGLASGLYLARISSGSSVQVERLVRQ